MPNNVLAKHVNGMPIIYRRLIDRLASISRRRSKQSVSAHAECADDYISTDNVLRNYMPPGHLIDI